MNKKIVQKINPNGSGGSVIECALECGS